jgi:hypothetical protein
MKMKICRNAHDIPKGLVFCNLKSAKTALPAAADIPTLVKEETPRYLVEAIDFPVKGTGGAYTKRFFQSFLDRMRRFTPSGETSWAITGLSGMISIPWAGKSRRTARMRAPFISRYTFQRWATRPPIPALSGIWKPVYTIVVGYAICVAAR